LWRWHSVSLVILEQIPDPCAKGHGLLARLQGGTLYGQINGLLKLQWSGPFQRHCLESLPALRRFGRLEQGLVGGSPDGEHLHVVGMPRALATPHRVKTARDRDGAIEDLRRPAKFTGQPGLQPHFLQYRREPQGPGIGRREHSGLREPELCDLAKRQGEQQLVLLLVLPHWPGEVDRFVVAECCGVGLIDPEDAIG
jgi:hypothetical protein